MLSSNPRRTAELWPDRAISAIFVLRSGLLQLSDECSANQYI